MLLLLISIIKAVYQLHLIWSGLLVDFLAKHKNSYLLTTGCIIDKNSYLLTTGCIIDKKSYLLTTGRGIEKNSYLLNTGCKIDKKETQNDG